MSLFKDGSGYSILIVGIVGVLLPLLESFACFDLLNSFGFFFLLRGLLCTIAGTT